jgi:hypothetical protein
MQVEMGVRNLTDKWRWAHRADEQQRPIVMYTRVPDEWDHRPDEIDIETFRSHLTERVMRGNGITQYPGAEVLLPFTHPTMGLVRQWTTEPAPDWVWSDDPKLQRLISEYHQIPEGRPDGYEEVYWRRQGYNLLAPGVPNTIGDATALITNTGVTAMQWTVGGGATGSVGAVFHGSAANASTVTTNLTLTTNQYQGATVYVADTTNTQIVFGFILSNNNTGGASVLTVDQWYTPGTQAAATTPAAGFEGVIVWSPMPWFLMGVTTTNISPAATDTSMTGEATTQGMARKSTAISAGSASAGSITFSVATTYTFTGSSATTFYAMGLFNGKYQASTPFSVMLFETLFSGSFTVTNNGDQATVTDTITAS